MNKKEEIFLNEAIEYKKQYEECPWWKFRKRRKLYKNWQKSLDLMVIYGS